jgi:hypothetical protein
MQPVLNRQLFTQKTFDSGSLGVLVSVVHQFGKPGRHDGIVLRNGVDAGAFSFVVDERSEAGQLSIDLATVGQPAKASDDCCRKREKPLVVSPKGYVLFFVSRGAGYSVRVGTGDAKEAVFDSQQLTRGDLFALTLLEPTKYSAVDRLGGARGEINVRFSREDAAKLKALPPVYVEATGQTFEPATIDLIATQGLVFRVQKTSRIVLEKQGGISMEEWKTAFQWRARSLRAERRKT